MPYISDSEYQRFLQMQQQVRAQFGRRTVGGPESFEERVERQQTAHGFTHADLIAKDPMRAEWLTRVRAENPNYDWDPVTGAWRYLGPGGTRQEAEDQAEFGRSQQQAHLDIYDRTGRSVRGRTARPFAPPAPPTVGGPAPPAQPPPAAPPGAQAPAPTPPAEPIYFHSPAEEEDYRRRQEERERRGQLSKVGGAS